MSEYRNGTPSPQDDEAYRQTPQQYEHEPSGSSYTQQPSAPGTGDPGQGAYGRQQYDPGYSQSQYQSPYDQSPYGQTPYQQYDQPQYGPNGYGRQPGQEYGDYRYRQPYGQQQYGYQPIPQGYVPRQKLVAGLLGILLGSLGIHNFYLGYTGRAIAQLLLTLVGWIIIIGPCIAGIWGLIEGILILCSNYGSKWHCDARGVELRD